MFIIYYLLDNSRFFGKSFGYDCCSCFFSWAKFEHCFFHLTYSGSSAKRSYVIPLVVAIAVFAVFVAIIAFVFKTRLQRQRNGRMKLTEHHADTLPHPYPEEKTFENPIYQVSEHLTKLRQHCHPSLTPTPL